MPSLDALVDYLVQYGIIHSEKVENAMRKIDRAQFVPPLQQNYAYEDLPLPIGWGQTISAPHMYAMMLEAGEVEKGMKVLEIGTGSGYGAALLKEMVGSKGAVYSIETIPELAEFARQNLMKAGYDAKVIVGDGNEGYEQASPYERIFVTAGASEIPPSLLVQLQIEGIMLIPLGEFIQELILLKKTGAGIERKNLGPCIFVPLVKK